MDVEKLKKMASAVRTGGKGSMRRWLFILVDICKNDALAFMHSYLLHIVFFFVLLACIFPSMYSMSIFTHLE
jgi:hypothetical protein